MPVNGNPGHTVSAKVDLRETMYLVEKMLELLKSINPQRPDAECALLLIYFKSAKGRMPNDEQELAKVVKEMSIALGAVLNG